MLKNDEVPLRHMLDAARKVQAFTEGKERRDLNEDEKLLLSLVKLIEIIGEAAVQISETSRKQLPTLPWPNIIGMRNRLVHAYFDINHDVVWKTVIEDIPGLIAELELLVSEEK
ncbi:MAG: DUF86 domain-containing protein [Gammaproteobacteria bacterium]|nr:DUF86 domain-containing protein [Gammaproteobacteria bacterium]